MNNISCSKPRLCTGPRWFVSGIARALWHRLPLSVNDRIRVRNALFKGLPFLFMNTPSYRSWKTFNMQPAEGGGHSGVLSDKGHNQDIEGKFGINIVGSITSESGVGEAVRGEIKAIETACIPFALNNIVSNSRENDDTYANFVEENPYSINLIHLNADSLPVFFNLKGKEYLRNKYNIGYWVWELSEFPEQWHPYFMYFDEIWTASNFCVDALSKVSPVPVMRLPHTIQIKSTTGKRRHDYGFSDGSFVFLFAFDFLSFIERKNPLAVIEAFRLAFVQNDDALLIIKCTNSSANAVARDAVLKAVKGLRVKIIDEYLDKKDLHNLISLCNCYVSLHRSEGFGLTMAEAMFFGKPVIATGYSGNMDFMNVNNSFPVKYKIIEIEKDIGPYMRGNMWADPDCEHAAELMRYVYENRIPARKIGEIGSRDIQSELNPRRIGQRISKRVEIIMNNRQSAIGR